MDEIAVELGISKKTLYQHFQNKAELVERTLEGHIADDTSAIRGIHDQSGNAIDEMIAIFEHASASLRGLNPTAIHDLRKYYPALWGRYQHYKDEFVLETIRENLQKGMAEGWYRMNLNADIVSRIYASALDNIMDENRFPLMQYGLLNLYSEFIRYHLHGILSPKGIEYYQKTSHV